MANTYTQIYLHVVFAVKNRESLIMPEYESELYAYMRHLQKSQTPCNCDKWNSKSYPHAY